MNFASDNTAPVAPAILDALVEANRGFALGYGNDNWTHAIERRFCEIFEREVAAFLVPTGTASNALALAQVTPPWGVVPWQLLALMEEAVTRGVAAFSETEAKRRGAPWLDLARLFTFAWAGCLLGVLSLRIVHRVVRPGGTRGADR